MHDLNKDNLIDGIEILKALTHDHGDHGDLRQPETDEGEAERLVDAVLDDLDFNGDGVIDYSEYLKRQ
uniref:EF-hand domain-containing protein n=1 Tax=Caenorhabditis tropicalis TaxID=1561998 RepID=A0A1I7T5F0_9PELO